MDERASVERLAAAVLDAAQRAFDRGDWDEAGQLAKEVLVILPGDKAATAMLAAVEQQRGHDPAEQGRRYLTVLFSDVVGSTPLSERLDPEDYVSVIRAYRDVVRSALLHHGGHIDQFQGDGVVAYFGYPTAAEDDEVHAVEAGLEIVTDVVAAGRELGLDLEARVAVHVGRTVLTGTELGTRDKSAAISFAANVAARIQAEARPGTVVVSEAAATAAAQYFDLSPLPPVSLRGLSAPMRLFEVHAPRALTTRGDARLAQPLVGRLAERARLDAAWAAAKGDGDASRVVVLLGEAGMGKSRLVRHATDLAHADDAGLIEINCGRALSHVGLGALRRAMEKALAVGPTPAPGAVATALDARGHLVGLSKSSISVLSAVLGDTSVADAAPELSPDRLREAIIRSLLEWITAEAARAPMLLVVEDLQWADDTAVEIIRRLTARALPEGLVAVLTSRADGLPAALAGLRREAVVLDPLPGDDSMTLVRTLPGGDGLTEDIVRVLAERGEGVPLFTEHLVLAAQAAGGSEPDALPTTLEGLLQTRIAATGAGRAVAEVAAVVGREFSLAVLERTLTGLGERAPCRPERARGGLRLLERAGLVEPEDSSGRLRFRHSLVRDVAYEMQLRRDRPHRHRAVAVALAALDGQDAAPSALAYHHEQAGDHEQAVAAYLRAAEQAADMAEFDQALQHLRSAGTLVEGIDSPAARRLELARCMQVGGVAAASFSYGQAEAIGAYERALVLCDLLGTEEGEDVDVQLVGALGGLWSKEVVAGDIPAARAITDRLERLHAGSSAAELEVRRFALSCRGLERLYAGDTTGAISALSQIFSVDAPGPVSVTLGTPHDYVAAAGAILAVARTLAGDDGGADAALQVASTRARQLAFPIGPFSEAVVEVYASYLHRLRGDATAARRSADAIGELGDRHGFQEHSMLGQMLGLAAGAVDGDQEACQALDGTLSLWRMTGGGLAVPALLGELAEGYLRGEDLDRARVALDAGLAMLDTTDQRGAQPALERVAAQVDAAAGAPVEDVVQRLVGSAELSLRQGSTRLAARAIGALRAVVPDGTLPESARPVAIRVAAAVPPSANAELQAVAGWISASV